MAQEVGIGLGLDGETGKVVLNQACKNQHEKPSLGESPTKNMEKRKTKSNEEKTKESQKEPKRTKNSSRRRLVAEATV
jgi:hypothetical protein